jgi:hypothetical protein
MQYDEIIQRLKKIGNPEYIIVPQDEFQRWQNAVKPVIENWINEMEAKGLPGRSIYERCSALNRQVFEVRNSKKKDGGNCSLHTSHYYRRRLQVKR